MNLDDLAIIGWAAYVACYGYKYLIRISDQMLHRATIGIDVYQMFWCTPVRAVLDGVDSQAFAAGCATKFAIFVIVLALAGCAKAKFFIKT